MECIEWWGTRDSNGYGVVKRKGRMVKAHRMVWEECFGPIPKGLFICHHCDNPPCVNPLHLFPGTAADNNRDMMEKGRARFPGAPTKTHCKSGHEFTPENTAWTTRGKGKPYLMKVCRQCQRARALAYYHRTKKLKNRLEVKEIK